MTPALPSEVEAALRGALRDRADLMQAAGLSRDRFLESHDEHVRATDPVVRALVEWRSATSEVQSPERSSIPITVTFKDLIDVAGFSTRFGSVSGMRRYPKGSSAVARLVTERGFTVIGKAETSEFGLGVTSHARNPRHPEYSPSGSSSGSGVAVAAGLCDLSVATDTLASSRYPAANCGVVGLRLTHPGRRMDGVMSVSPSLDAIGLLARTCDDLNLVLGRLGLCPTASPAHWPRRVRVVTNWLGEDYDDVVGRSWDSFTGRLREAGIEVEDVTLPRWIDRRSAWQVMAREAADVHRRLAVGCPVDYSSPVRAVLAEGSLIGDEEYREARSRMIGFGRALTDLVGDEPTPLVLPLDANAPRRVDAPRYERVAQSRDREEVPDPGLGSIPSQAGLPCLALPLPCKVGEPPLAAQLIGPQGSEAWLGRIGSVLEVLMALD